MVGAFRGYMLEKSKSILSNLEFFAHLNESEIDFLVKSCEIIEYDENEVLFYERDEKDKMYYLIEGEIKIYKVDRFDNEIFLYYLNVHDLVTDFIDMEAKLKACYANAVFTKKSRVICIDFEIFIKLLQQNVKFYQNFIKECKRRLDRLERVITRDVVYDGTAKVAYELTNNLDKFNSLKKHEIAYELHMQPETLSRILAKMVRNGLIKIVKNRVKILDIDELRGIYE